MSDQPFECPATFGHERTYCTGTQKTYLELCYLIISTHLTAGCTHYKMTTPTSWPYHFANAGYAYGMCIEKCISGEIIDIVVSNVPRKYAILAEVILSCHQLAEMQAIICCH